MIIAITGVTGFIGEKLALFHLAMGHKVRGLTRKNTLRNKDIEYFIGDLRDPHVNLNSFLNSVDVLYHCAGEINDESIMFDLHVNGTARILEASVGNVKKFIQLNSVGAYGPIYQGIINEKNDNNPRGEYEKTKALSDDLVIAGGIPYCIVRPSNVFSKAMKNQSLFNLVNFIHTGWFFYIGKGSIVNYVHVEDVVRGLVLCGSNEKALSKVFIISQNIPLSSMVSSIIEGKGTVKNKFITLPENFVRFIAKIVNKFYKSPLTLNRINALTSKSIYDSSKIELELGFKYKTSLKDRFIKFSNSESTYEKD